MDAQTHEVTKLLLAVFNGDEAAANQLWDAVYQELQRIAHRELRGERLGHTLNTTALVNEVYLKLVDQKMQVPLQNRRHFFALACRAMRQILVNHARARNARKRAGRKHEVSLIEAGEIPVKRDEDLLALDEALTRLEAWEPRQAQVIELRFFGGYSMKEIAGILGIGIRTAQLDWEKARTYLYRDLRSDA